MKFMPKMIQKLKENNFVVKDVYKKGKPEIPTKGGVAILFTSFLTLALIPVIFNILTRIDSSIEVPD